MEQMYKQIADQARADKDAAQQAAATKDQELGAVCDELQQQRDKLEQLTKSEANWRSRHEALTQQVIWSTGLLACHLC